MCVHVHVHVYRSCAGGHGCCAAMVALAMPYLEDRVSWYPSLSSYNLAVLFSVVFHRPRDGLDGPFRTEHPAVIQSQHSDVLWVSV